MVSISACCDKAASFEACHPLSGCESEVAGVLAAREVMLPVVCADTDGSKARQEVWGWLAAFLDELSRDTIAAHAACAQRPVSASVSDRVTNYNYGL